MVARRSESTSPMAHACLIAVLALSAQCTGFADRHLTDTGAETLADGLTGKNGRH